MAEQQTPYLDFSDGHQVSREAKAEAAASESAFDSDSDSDSDSGSEVQEAQAREAEALARAQSEASRAKAKKGRIAQLKQPAAQGPEAEAKGKRLDGRPLSRGKARGGWDSSSLSLSVLLALLICALAWLVSNWSSLELTLIVKPTASEKALIKFSRTAVATGAI